MDNMFLRVIIAFYNQAKAYATKGLSKKADKVAGATQGGTAVFDAEGNLTDSGVKPLSVSMDAMTVCFTEKQEVNNGI